MGAPARSGDERLASGLGRFGETRASRLGSAPEGGIEREWGRFAAADRPSSSRFSKFAGETRGAFLKSAQRRPTFRRDDGDFRSRRDWPERGRFGQTPRGEGGRIRDRRRDPDPDRDWGSDSESSYVRQGAGRREDRRGESGFGPRGRGAAGSELAARRAPPRFSWGESAPRRGRPASGRPDLAYKNRFAEGAQDGGADPRLSVRPSSPSGSVGAKGMFDAAGQTEDFPSARADGQAGLVGPALPPGANPPVSSAPESGRLAAPPTSQSEPALPPPLRPAPLPSASGPLSASGLISASSSFPAFPLAARPESASGFDSAAASAFPGARRARLGRAARADAAWGSGEGADRGGEGLRFEAGPETMRLSKALAERGVCSRREADAFIESGWATVNGQVAQVGQKVGPGDVVVVSRRVLGAMGGKLSVALNKPLGYVSHESEDGYPRAARLIVAANFAGRRQDLGAWGKPGALARAARSLAPAGRLDVNSSGLLVLTQDGRVAKAIIGEGSKLEKEYLVRFAGNASEAALAKLRFGLSLDGVPLLPAQVERQNEDQLKFVLREGKNRQIRRMCELVGLRVLALKRVRIGALALGPLPPGKWRFVDLSKLGA